MPPSIRESAFAELAPAGGSPSRWGRARLLPAQTLRRWPGRAGFALVSLIVGLALFGPLLAPYDPFTITGSSLARPSASHPMGTDAIGRDVFSALLFGARTSVVVATAVSVVALAIGSVVGLIAGYRGGWVDDLLTRTTELFQVIPRFFFAIVAIALFGPGLDRMIITLGVTSWPILARLVRGEVIALREQDFIVAAEAIGVPRNRIVRYHLLPNVLPVIVVALGLLFGQVLLLEATLAFLGLGDPGAVSWGLMAAQAQGFLRTAWWLALFPGLAITLAVLGVNLLADALTSSRAAG